MPEAVITGGARTAIGRLLGSLKDFTAADLGGIVDQGGAGALRHRPAPTRTT